MTNAPTTNPESEEEPQAPKAPKMLRLFRDGVFWQLNAPWPSPGSLPQLPFEVSDIFYDDDEEGFVVFGMPRKPKKGETASRFFENGICIRASVPLELGSAIVEAILPITEAIAEAKNHVLASEDAWADRWTDDDDEPEAAPPGEPS